MPLIFCIRVMYSFCETEVEYFEYELNNIINNEYLLEN